MLCRSSCGACCIAPSISSAIPGMPNGKPAGVRCIHLLLDKRCALFGDPSRPIACGIFTPHEETCGSNKEQAIALLNEMEQLTNPDIIIGFI